MAINQIYGYIRVPSIEDEDYNYIYEMNNLVIPSSHIITEILPKRKIIQPQLEELKKILSKNDLLYIGTLDMLGKSYECIFSQWIYITKTIQANIIILEEKELFNTTKIRGQISANSLEEQLISFLSYLANKEKMKRGKSKNIVKKIGRPPITLDSLSNEQKELLYQHYQEWKQKKIKSIEFIKMLSLKKNTFYKIIKEFEKSLRE